jgi:hypothetical protein
MAGAALARHVLLLRAPLTVMVLALMTLTAIGSYGLLTRAHLQHQVAAQEGIDRDAAPIAQQIALAKATVANLDARIAQFDAMVKTATACGYIKTARAHTLSARSAGYGPPPRREVRMSSHRPVWRCACCC